MCNCEDRPCCGCGQEEDSQESQHEAWLDRVNAIDDSGCFDEEQCEDDDDEPRFGGDESLSDDVGRLLAEDAFLDAEYEGRTDTGDFDF